MATLYESGYNRTYYTETSGTWVAPSTCFKALVIIAGGGGGGGGGGGAGAAPVGTAGAAGSAGGNTTFVGPNGVSLTSVGGSAGTAGAVGGGPQASGFPGTGGYNSGNVSRARSGARMASFSGSMGGQFISANHPQSELYDTMKLAGGNGGTSSGIYGPAASYGFGNFAEAGIGVNAGTGGGIGSGSLINPSSLITVGGPGGNGGSAIGEKYPVKITPGASYTITIGSGGAGGAGGTAGPAASTSNPGGGGGGGGASGFVMILWNDVLQGT